MADLTRRQIQIMKILDEHGSRSMAQLRTTFDLMQDLAFRGLASGWFYRMGSTKDDQIWDLTDKGRAALVEAVPGWTLYEVEPWR